jgi:hypothetical protein
MGRNRGEGRRAIQESAVVKGRLEQARIGATGADRVENVARAAEGSARRQIGSHDAWRNFHVLEPETRAACSTLSPMLISALRSSPRPKISLLMRSQFFATASGATFRPQLQGCFQ